MVYDNCLLQSNVTTQAVALGIASPAEEYVAISSGEDSEESAHQVPISLRRFQKIQNERETKNLIAKRDAEYALQDAKAAAKTNAAAVSATKRMLVCDGIRWCMVVYGGVWWCMVVYGGVWWCTVVYAAVFVRVLCLKCTLVHGDIYGGLWWCMILFCCNLIRPKPLLP